MVVMTVVESNVLDCIVDLGMIVKEFLNCGEDAEI